MQRARVSLASRLCSLLRPFPLFSPQVHLPLGEAGAASRAELARVEGFRDVHPERRVTRHLSAFPFPGSSGDTGAQPFAAAPAPPPQQQGRRQTRPTLGLGLHAPAQAHGTSTAGGRRRLLQSGRAVSRELGAPTLWSQGATGQGVRMAVFDTGVRADHPHFRKIAERTNWTAEKSLDDGLGHGTFVAGVILGTDGGCPGFAPDAELYTFRVFTNAQLSYTSWFLDAFNYAIARDMHVINLSIGGPDYLDAPFVEKIWEVTANGIIMVSAIGNDGPLYGTLNNPADQMDVLGVGGIDFNGAISSFSSRGMTTGELPGGFGRFKPDVVAFGRDVMGSKIQGGCRSLSGTSVASPVVAGAVVLLASSVPPHLRATHVTPASMKQALVEGAVRLPGPHIFEQGAGKLHVLNSAKILAKYTPRASALPAQLHLDDCPYMWPFCSQPLYAGAQPLIVNVTLLNGMAVTGWLQAPPVWAPTVSKKDLGEHLDVSFTYSERLWPWSGFLGVFIRVHPSAAALSGVASGEIRLTVVSPGAQSSEVRIPVRAAVVGTPAREKRVLWSVWHNIPYPPGYIPRDNLDASSDILDWHGDHPGTNYHQAYDALRREGFFVETLREPITCFDAAQYGTLMLVDTEEEFLEKEVSKLHADVTQRGLSLLVSAEWYHVPTMEAMRFFDDNTHSYWTPYTGGANVPALNQLLAPFGVAFGDRVLKGRAQLGAFSAPYASGANIARFPAGGNAHVAGGLSDASGKNAGWGSAESGVAGQRGNAVLGLLRAGQGRLAAWGDSSCLDSSHSPGDCFALLCALLRFTGGGEESPTLFTPQTLLGGEGLSTPEALPLRRADVNFSDVSKVLAGKWTACAVGPAASTPPAHAQGGEEAPLVDHPQPPASPEAPDPFLLAVHREVPPPAPAHALRAAIEDTWALSSESSGQREGAGLRVAFLLVGLAGGGGLMCLRSRRSRSRALRLAEGTANATKSAARRAE